MNPFLGGPDDTPEAPSVHMAALEELVVGTGMWTGLRARLIADGWTPGGAEALTLETQRSVNATREQAAEAKLAAMPRGRR